MPTDQIFPEKSTPAPAAPEPASTPPRWRMPFWLWLVIIVIAAAVVVILVFWLGGIKLPMQETEDTTETIVTPTPENEKLPIVITNPQAGDTISSPVTITGRGTAFESTIILRIKDSKGNVLAQVPTTTDSTEPGVKGDFSESVSYQMPATEYGFVEAYDESTDDGSPKNLFTTRVHFADWSETATTSQAHLVFQIETYEALQSYDLADDSMTDFSTAFNKEFGGKVTLKGSTAYVAKASEDDTSIEVNKFDLVSGDEESVTAISGSNGQIVVPSGIAAAPQEDKVAIGVGYVDDAVLMGESPAEYKVFVYDLASGETSEVYSKESPGVYFVADLKQWSAANELFIYEFIGDALGGAFGETIKVNLASGDVTNISSEYSVSGSSTVSPDGTKIAFVEPGNEATGVDPGIIMVNLVSGDKETIYGASSQEEMDEIGVGLLASTVPEWTSDGTKLVWGGTDAIFHLTVADQSLGEIPYDPEGTFMAVFPLAGKAYGGIMLDNAAGSRVVEFDLASGTTQVVYDSDLTALLLGVF